MRTLSLILAATVVLTAAGCGGSSKKAPSAGSPPVSLAGSVTNHGTKDVSGAGTSASLELEQDDFYFQPSFIKAAPSQTIEVEVKNEGKVTHTFTVDSLSVDQEVPAGSTKKVTLTLPASGVVSFYCRFHKGQGMQGARYFHPGDSAGTGGQGTTTSTSSTNGY